MKIGRYLFLICLLLCIIPVHAEDAVADVDFSPRLQRAYFDIQKLKLTAARQAIDEERQLHPQNPFIQYLDNYADLHYLLISEDRNAYRKLSALEETRLAAVAKMPDNSPFRRFFQAEIRLHWAFAKMKFGNEGSGAWDVIKAYKLLEENKRRFPEFTPTLKSLGLLHVLIGSVPESYTWVTKFLGLRGNIALGVQEIETVIREEPLFAQESRLVHLLIHAYILQLSDQQQQLIRQLPTRHPDNLLLHFFATTMLMKEGKSKEASQFLNKAPDGPAYIAFPFLEYLRGEISLQQGNYEAASKHYLVFLERYKGFNFIKDAHFKLFLCHWLNGREDQAAKYMERVPKVGSNIVEGDKFATKMAAEWTAGRLPTQQKVLFKARYATDGGYLEDASSLINSVNENSFARLADKAEYQYRKGRILQKKSQSEAALPCYERAILLAKDDAPGIGASAALQAGYLYKDQKQNSKAIAYFRKALSFKKYEFKNSIDNKARAALTELGQ